MKQWLQYFLVGIEKIATRSTENLSKVLELKKTLELIINKNFGKKSQNATILLLHLFENPSLYVKEVQAITKLTYKAANYLFDDFVKAEILEEITGQSRNRVFIFRQYINLFK